MTYADKHTILAGRIRLIRQNLPGCFGRIPRMAWEKYGLDMRLAGTMCDR